AAGGVATRPGATAATGATAVATATTTATTTAASRATGAEPSVARHSVPRRHAWWHGPRRPQRRAAERHGAVPHGHGAGIGRGAALAAVSSRDHDDSRPDAGCRR